MFQRIAYVSRAMACLTEACVYDIIRTAHNRNCAAGLTGGLLVMDGCFIQVLEGDRFRVRECFQAIARDPRHTDVDLRLDESTRQLLFTPEWMALRQGHQIPADLKAAFGYLPGLPGASFTGAQVVAFVQACCRQDSALQPA
jgi:hypothetical protein